MAELLFTLYTGPRAWANTLGHVLLDVSTVLVYTAIMATSTGRMR